MAVSIARNAYFDTINGIKINRILPVTSNFYGILGGRARLALVWFFCTGNLTPFFLIFS